ncbi:hypothetical protein ACFY03_08835 [Micromonospora chersina]|uniref:hypothetical protein n=1 Tax=Micromonospora chersina TaxID=47854 RepID=UPI0036A91659
MGERETIPTSAAARKAATAEVATETTAGTGDAELVRVGLDAIATLLVPAKNGRHTAEVEATCLLLNLPDDSGALPVLPLWPQQPLVATTVGVAPGRIAQILGKQRKRWHDLPVVASVRTQVIELLRDGGRVMGVAGLADAARAGSGDVWLLCPMEDPRTLPKLDGAVVRVGDNEWIALPDAWVVNAHRSAVVAS